MSRSSRNHWRCSGIVARNRQHDRDESRIVQARAVVVQASLAKNAARKQPHSRLEHECTRHFLPVPGKCVGSARVMDSACRGETSSPVFIRMGGIYRVLCSREQLLSDYGVRVLMLCGCNGSLPIAPDSNKLYIKQALSGDRYDRISRVSNNMRCCRPLTLPSPPITGERGFRSVAGFNARSFERNRIGFQISGELS